MDKKTLATVTPDIREAYQQALRLSKESERLLALKDLVNQEPGFVEARRKLRDLERRKVMATPAIGRFFARLGAPAGKIKSLTKTVPLKAMALCEDTLVKTLDNPPILELLADAAERAGAPFISAEAMERASELRPLELRYMLLMAAYLQKAGRAEEAMKRLHAVAVNHPDNKDVQAAYRNAINADAKQREQAKTTGMASVDQGGGSNAMGSRAAAILQLLENTIHDAAQAKLVVVELLKVLATGESLDVRRKLASAYNIMGEYDKAIEEIQRVIAATAAYDPTLDKRLEEAEIGKIDKEIGMIKRRPPKDLADPDARIAELELEREQLKLDHALSRIAHYPNDIGLVFDLGRLRLERGEYDLAIEQFMTSRTSAASEVPSRLSLAECYEKMGNYPKAVDELETVLSILPRLDKDRLKTAYSLARIMEVTGKPDKAIELYRGLLEMEPRFRDAAARLKALEESGAPSAAEAQPEQPAQQ